jgi:tetrahydromethanopterin S-methyltransferase subunit A
MSEQTGEYKPTLRDRLHDWQWRVMRLWRKTVGRVVDWPPAPGHFMLGNGQSAVAVCTLSSTALIDQLDTEYVAIIGRVYTANIGLEKMIRNVVSNPKLRYLVLCGKESPVFKVGEALLMLRDNGLDDAGKIIRATGANPELVNLPRETVATFLEQITLINCIGETNPRTLDGTTRELFERQTAPYNTDSTTELHLAGDAPITIEAGRRRWLDLDPHSYFIINLDRERGEIAVERYTTDKKLTHVIRGRAADMLYHTIIKEKLLTQFDHAAYLGAELAKAETALYNNLQYEQDKKLRLQ